MKRKKNSRKTFSRNFLLVSALWLVVVAIFIFQLVNQPVHETSDIKVLAATSSNAEVSNPALKGLAWFTGDFTMPTCGGSGTPPTVPASGGDKRNITPSTTTNIAPTTSSSSTTKTITDESSNPAMAMIKLLPNIANMTGCGSGTPPTVPASGGDKPTITPTSMPNLVTTITPTVTSTTNITNTPVLPTTIVENTKAIDYKDVSTYKCPQSNKVTCMPLAFWDTDDACNQNYIDWVRKNCPE